jgi:hypothetical protein
MWITSKRDRQFNRPIEREHAPAGAPNAGRSARTCAADPAGNGGRPTVVSCASCWACLNAIRELTSYLNGLPPNVYVCDLAFFSNLQEFGSSGSEENAQKMSEISIAQFKDYDVSPDGRKAVLHFIDGDGRPVAIEVETLELEKIAHNLGFVLTKARQASDIYKQGVVPFLRPTRVQADLLGRGSVVILSFAMRGGVEMHYGLEPIHANAFARQIKEAARRGLKGKPLGQH